MANAVSQSLIDRGFNQEAVSAITEEMASYYNRLNAIGSKVLNCEACSLRDGCRAPTPGLGPLRPELLVVSDHPMNDESSGVIEMSMFMMILFGQLGLKIEDIYWTHAVKCSTNRVTQSNVNQCHLHLVNEIAVLQPAAIVAVGSTAISSLTGELLNIDDAVGGEYEFEAGSKTIPIIPVYHPRSLMNLSNEDIKTKVNRMWKYLQPVSEYL